MKTIVLSILLFSLSSIAGIALADSAVAGNVTVSVENNDQDLVEISGEAAQALFNSLNVQAIGSFGMVQTFTKTLDKVKCTQAIMGDVRRSTSAPNYSCSILVDRK